MAELKWLDGYTGQTTDELIALEGKYRTDSLVVAFDQALNQKEARLGSKGLTAEERVIQAIEALEAEVNNGGYHQFFVNSSVEYAPIIVDALHRIECHEVATITEEAIRALAIQGPITVEAIERVIDDDNEKRSKKLNQCDGRYFKVAGDLAGPLLKFIQHNRNRINLKG